MPLIPITLAGLYNGVSQQPPTMRLDTQAELQENAYGLLVDGLTKRPPTEFVAALTGSEADGVGTKIHAINRDASEQYIVLFTNEETEPIEIYTLDGTKCTVLYDTGTKDYVVVDNPRTDLEAVTIADHTIIANTTVTAALDSTADTIPNPRAVVWVKKGLYDSTYKLTVNDGTADHTITHETEDASSATDINYQTGTIASAIMTALQTELGTTNWSFTLLGSSFVIERTDGEDFSVRSSDSFGNQALAAIKGSVQRFQDLPPEAPDGLVLKVEGDADSQFDNFYVKFHLDSDGSGVWRETVGPGQKNNLDATTLPHRLVRTGTNEFTLKTCEWEPRKVGDLESAPDPSFIGNKINDVFFFKNRLGLLAGENVILSRSSDFFNFFPSTALDVLDDDPIDVAVSSTSVAILRSAVPYVNSLLLFSDHQQFQLHSGTSPLTPSTVAIDNSTSFETDPHCKPVSMGSMAYFVVPNGDHSNVREYFVQPDSLTNDAANITAHVPRYLPQNIYQLVASTAKDTLFALSFDEPDTIYVYKFYWEGDRKVQSSWSKWIYDDDIAGAALFENYLYMVIHKQDTGVNLVRLNLEKEPTGVLPFRVHLDKQFSDFGTYDADTNKTTWDIPYTDMSDEFVIVTGDKGNQILGVTKPTDTTLTAPGDHSEILCYIGKPYTMKYRFSRQYVRDGNGVAMTQGRLQLRTLTLSFTNTGTFTIKAGDFEKTYTAVVLGVSTIGQPSLQDAEETFLIMKNAAKVDIDIINDSYLPSEFQTAMFETFWTSRSRQF